MPVPKRRTIPSHWSAHDMYPVRRSQSHSEIQRAVEHLFPRQPFATHGSVVADLLVHKLADDPQAIRHPKIYRDAIISEVMRERAGMVGTILVYSENVHGGRRPKSQVGQVAGFKRNLYAAWRDALVALERVQSMPGAMGDGGDFDIISDNGGAADTGGDSDASQPLDGDSSGEPGSTEPDPTEPDSSPAVSAVADTPSDWLAWCQHGASVLERRDADGQEVEVWGMRRTIDGTALAVAGCPVPALKDMVTCHLGDDIRRELQVEPFDFVEYGVERYLMSAVSARVPLKDGTKRAVPIYLFGPASSGKSTLAQSVAENLGLDFGGVDMIGGTPPSAFYGFAPGGGQIVQSHFEKILRDGGAYGLDEIDASDPNLLVIINKPLANGIFFNRLTGETHRVHPDTVWIASGNTLGYGADRVYVGRERLDGATLERFMAGRIRVTIDRALEARLSQSIIDAAEGSA